MTLALLLLAVCAGATDFETQALDALRAGRLREAVETLETWNAAQPRDAYVENLLAGARARLEDSLKETPGVFWRAAALKAIAPEAVDTPRPLRVVYETRETSARLRARAAAPVDVLASASVRQLSQRNLTAGFSYFDVLEQTYSAGLDVRPAEKLAVSGEYVQSAFSDIHGAAIGERTFAGARGRARWRARDELTLGLSGDYAPRLLRGAGGSQFFTLLRRASGEANAEIALAGWELSARGGFDAYSERTTYRRGHVAATRETKFGVFTPSYSHEQHEFYGATADGRFGAINLDRGGLRWARADGPVRAAVQYGYSAFADANRRHDAEGSLESAPALFHGFSARYVASVADWRSLTALYRSFDEQAHWTGGFWTRDAGTWNARVGGEHGWARDARGPWEANRASLAAAWRPARDKQLSAAAEVVRATVGDNAYRFSLDARWSF